eukprot:Blabericola_migrator_1__3795@NODE_2141_length_3217_cov_178_626032_g1355_i0_p2_GENE_NODE_2141_length_3217_cov_178_626032_g1355_i0NODE_2141_length_3217_cov_178_626032_g1355_i0_p2_ORF_typecomplete_len155_score7_83Nucleopor_Nup85/PF07575_13/0_17_NODE_2141_length_3217_cov_178_626032_g1355_i026783142
MVHETATRVNFQCAPLPVNEQSAIRVGVVMKALDNVQLRGQLRGDPEICSKLLKDASSHGSDGNATTPGFSNATHSTLTGDIQQLISEATGPEIWPEWHRMVAGTPSSDNQEWYVRTTNCHCSFNFIVMEFVVLDQRGVRFHELVSRRPRQKQV